MKRVSILIVIMILAFTTVTPALAAGHQYGTIGRGNFVLSGYISGIDPVAKTLTVKVMNGNMLVRPFVGNNLLITTTTATRYLFNDGLTIVEITFDDLAVGDPVSVRGLLSGTTWTALRITKGAKLIHYP